MLLDPQCREISILYIIYILRAYIGPVEDMDFAAAILILANALNTECYLKASP